MIQKIIELVPRRHIGFVTDALRGQVSQLSSHNYGCRVIQRMLEHGTDEDKKAIMDEIHNCINGLFTDQYGNYVAQHVIESGDQCDRVKIIAAVTSQILTLSKHKFASNVVEKCIQCGTLKERLRIRDEFMTVGRDGSSALQMTIKDQYANYVIREFPHAALTRLEASRAGY